MRDGLANSTTTVGQSAIPNGPERMCVTAIALAMATLYGSRSVGGEQASCDAAARGLAYRFR